MDKSFMSQCQWLAKQYCEFGWLVIVQHLKNARVLWRGILKAEDTIDPHSCTKGARPII